MVCPQCGGKMCVISFLTDHAIVDPIIDHPKPTFVADRPVRDLPMDLPLKT